MKYLSKRKRFIASPESWGSDMVFQFQNCFDLLWGKKCSSDRDKLSKFEAEGQEFAKVLGSLRTTI